jgi:hypothetical protein
MKATLLQETDNTARALQATLSSFPQEQVNIIPFPGSWTVGQVGEHLLLSATGVLETINGAVEPTKRDPAEKAGPIKKLFLDFGIKMTSPDFVEPSGEPKNKEALLYSLDKAMSGIRVVAESEDLTATCMSFEFPMFGHLTRLEWITFILAHVQRHVHQLNTIAGALAQDRLQHF